MREYPFELAVCARLERDPGVAGIDEPVLARQLGAGVREPGNRVIDVVLVEPGPRFEERARITPREIPAAAIGSRVGPGRARHPPKAFDCHPERARRIAEHAVEIGFFEVERRGGRELVRQVTRYPEGWFGRLVGIENKPDLGEPGDLETQLRKDASLALFDAVVLATESHVTGAHLNRIPEEVGVWRVYVDDEIGIEHGEVDIQVVRDPEPLPADEPGVELLAEHPGRTEIALVDAEEKARARRRLAERVYGKGWRPRELPACGKTEAGEIAGANGLPYCDWKGRLVNPAACGPDCPGYEPAEPPPADPDADRDARTPWVKEPEGAVRRQAGLDSFVEN